MLLFVEAGKLKRCPSNTALIEYNGRCILRWKRKMIFKEVDQELSERAKMYICPDNCVTPPLISANLPEHQVSRPLGNSFTDFLMRSRTPSPWPIPVFKATVQMCFSHWYWRSDCAPDPFYSHIHVYMYIPLASCFFVGEFEDQVLRLPLND